MDMGVYRTCPKCQESILRIEYGSQGYCKSCWNEYQATRRRDRQPYEHTLPPGAAATRRLEEDRDRILDQIDELQAKADYLTTRVEARRPKGEVD